MIKKKLIDAKDIEYIYTSPMTRCIQTAFYICKALEEYNKKIQIRIEYALYESPTYWSQQPLINIEDNNIIQKEKDYVYVEEFKKRMYTVVDEEQDFNNMNSSIYTKEIRNYIDYKYIPTLLHKECTIKDMNTTIKDYVQCLEKIKNYKHKNTIIVSHGGMNYIIFFR